jgi:outer membrane protein assembly factor BamB
VYALDAGSGKSGWEFTAGARVDSAPSVYADRVLFGSRDGYVYNLRSSDGVSAWRFRAARRERLLVAGGQLESVWPVHGSVLISDGVAFATAGRNSYLDGGIDFHRIKIATGELLSTTPIYSPDLQTGRQPEQYGPNGMPGVRSDLLACDAEHVYLRQMVFSKHGMPQEEGQAHLLTVSDFLDDTWPHRSYWIFGTHTSLSTGCSGREKGLIYGRLLAFDDSSIYGYGRETVHWSNQFEDGPYRIYATNRSDGTPRWETSVPIQVRAMVVAKDVLFAAGPSARSIEEIAQGKPAGEALLMAISAKDGSEVGRCQLDAEPILDGMAAAYGRLYVADADGSIVCLGGGATQ